MDIKVNIQNFYAFMHEITADRGFYSECLKNSFIFFALYGLFIHYFMV